MTFSDIDFIDAPSGNEREKITLAGDVVDHYEGGRMFAFTTATKATENILQKGNFLIKLSTEVTEVDKIS